MPFFRRIICLFLLPVSLAVAEPVTVDSPGWFPFPLGPARHDNLGLIDLAAMNECPAGKSGFVKVSGEQFTDGAGRPLKLFGTNITATALFPKKEEAARHAAHLASLGMNVVRCHFLDNMWGGDSLLQAPEYKTWNKDALDRFHFFAAELKARGIYLNLNLHVGRTYEGTPPEAPKMSKGVDLFHPPFIEQFKEYCRILLTTVNPYTKLAPKDDPSVAVLEMNNENTLVMNPWWINQLPEPFASEIQGLWNGWLGRNYSDEEAIKVAYGLSSGELGPELAQKPMPEGKDSPWRRDRATAGDSKLAPQADGVLRWEISAPGPQSWSHQYSLVTPGITDGTRFVLKFSARGDRARKMPLSFMQDEATYANTGLAEAVELQSAWKVYSYEFTAGQVEKRRTRLTFSANNEPGWIELKDVSLRSVPAGYLQSGQGLAKKNIPFPKRNAPEKVRLDAFRFLAELEMQWARDMKAFLQNDLAIKVPISHSHVLFGGMLGARRENAVSDFVDTHGYWQHPNFTKGDWDMKHWEIGNTSQLASSEGGTLLEMAMQRPAGKPYTVSEYDIPAPSDHAAEFWPMLASTACQQRWAGLYSYCWANGVGALAGEKIHGFFDQCGHPAKHGLVPVGALIYRMGLVPEFSTKARLNLDDRLLFADAAATNGDMWGSWRRIWQSAGHSGRLALDHRMALVFAGDGAGHKFDRVTKVPDSGPAASQWDAVKQTWTVTAPAVRCVTGKVSAQEFALGDSKIKFESLDGNGSATVVVVSLDGKPLEVAGRVLIVALRRAENAGMGWDEARKSVSDQWGTGPALVQGVKAKVQLPGKPWRLISLTNGGQEDQMLAENGNELAIAPEHKTIWYLAVRRP